MRRIALVAVGVALSLAGLIYTLYGKDFDALLASVHRIRALPLIASIAIYWGGLVVLRALFVRRLLAPLGAVPFGRIYRYLCVGFLVNNILPLKAGEVARIGGISRSSGIGFASVAGSLAVERALDMVMVALIGVCAFQLAPVPDSARFVVLVLGVGLLIGLTSVVIIARRGLQEVEPTGRWRLLRVIWNLAVRVSAGFGSLRTFGGIAGALGFAMSMWLLLIVVTMFRFAAFGLEPSLPMALVLVFSLALSVAVPSAPGYVGVYQVAAVFALGEVMGIEPEIAAGFAIFNWVADISMSNLFGLLSMIYEGLGWSDLRAKGEGG